MSDTVTFGATLEEYDGFLYIVRYYYPSRVKPLVELFYDFDEAVSSLERKGWQVCDYSEAAKMWHFLKHAKRRVTSQDKAVKALLARKGVSSGKAK